LRFFPPPSGTTQIDSSGRFLYVINGGSNGSLSVFQVKNDGADSEIKLGEVKVGSHPQSVSVHPDLGTAYVSNGADNTVSVINLNTFDETQTIAVGSEPRGTVLSPDGSTLYVSNFSDGTVSVIDTGSNTLTQTIDLGPDARPYAVAYQPDLDGLDTNDLVYVSDFFAEAVPGTPVDEVEGRNDGKQGAIYVINPSENEMSGKIPLAPKDSGFKGDRTPFDPSINPQAVLGNPYAGNSTVPEVCFPNQISGLTLDRRRRLLFVPSIGVSPEPPIRFDLNVQALVSVVDLKTNTENPTLTTNLNNLVQVENQPAGPPFNGTLQRAFMGDTVAMAVHEDTALFVSRAGSFVLRGSLNEQGQISLNNSAQNPAVRFPVGNIPDGITISPDGKRAYVNANVDGTISVLDLENNVTLSEFSSTQLPVVGTEEHDLRLGRLAFFTGMGLPPDGLSGLSVRDIDTAVFRGMASNSNWSSCASCHHEGTTDNITWIFPTGPRQTLPLDASFSKTDPNLRRVFNWNAVRSSVTDFNNNARGVQGGIGFTPNGNADANQVHNHGPEQGVSQALDLMTRWVRLGTRTFNAPSHLNPAQVAAGRQTFVNNACQACHGTPLFSCSRVDYPLPLFDADPLAGGNNLAPNRVLNTGTILQALDVTDSANFFRIPPNQAFFRDPVIFAFNVAGVPAAPTLDLTHPIEVRGGGPQIGQASVGAAGSFNPPSLRGSHMSAPYGHHGRARRFRDVFESIPNGGLGHPRGAISDQELLDLEAFVRSIDGTTPPI